MLVSEYLSQTSVLDRAATYRRSLKSSVTCWPRDLLHIVELFRRGLGDDTRGKGVLNDANQQKHSHRCGSDRPACARLHVLWRIGRARADSNAGANNTCPINTCPNNDFATGESACSSADTRAEPTVTVEARPEQGRVFLVCSIADSALFQQHCNPRSSGRSGRPQASTAMDS